MVTSPKTIRLHRYSDLLTKWWQTVNSEGGILTIVVCGARGKGKSWVMLLLAYLLDRTRDDDCRFSVDRVSFKASEFLEWLNSPDEKWRAGSVICLDDAGLHLYNRDSLTNFIKIINKTLQNIRYKHPIVILTLPSFGMLDKHARDMTDIYIEVVERDKKRRENRCKIQEINLVPYYGIAMRRNITLMKKKIHPRLGVEIIHREAIQYRIEAPPKEIVDAYEKKKRIYLNAYNRANIAALKREEDKIKDASKKKVKLDFSESVDYCKVRLDSLMDINRQGKVSIAKIMLLKDKNDNQLFERSMAVAIMQGLKQTIKGLG